MGSEKKGFIAKTKDLLEFSIFILLFAFIMLFSSTKIFKKTLFISFIFFIY